MCGMMYAWKRGNVIFGGWMLYIIISYRILSSLANNPDTVEDMYGYGTSVLYANLPGPVGFIILF